MLRIRLIGEMALEIDGTAAPPPASRRARSLLAWLALHPGPHARAEVAARFWPDVLDSSARTNLRSALLTLRNELGPAAHSTWRPAATPSVSRATATSGWMRSSSRSASRRAAWTGRSSWARASSWPAWTTTGSIAPATTTATG